MIGQFAREALRQLLIEQSSAPFALLRPSAEGTLKTRFASTRRAPANRVSPSDGLITNAFPFLKVIILLRLQFQQLEMLIHFQGLHGTQINTNGASLGQPCSTWAQCQAVDPNSACVNGVCDCLVEGPVQCSWNNTGCHPSTFQVKAFVSSCQPVCNCNCVQCRSSGRCISLALTCNGHPDCEDSSDELFCDRHPCPPGSFPCGSHCISGMFICDGNIDIRSYLKTKRRFFSRHSALC